MLLPFPSTSGLRSCLRDRDGGPEVHEIRSSIATSASLKMQRGNVIPMRPLSTHSNHRAGREPQHIREGLGGEQLEKVCAVCGCAGRLV